MVFSHQTTAQIGKDYWDLTIKGPVQKQVMTNIFNLNTEDGDQTEGPRNQVTSTYVKGREVSRETEISFSSSTLTSVTEFDWEEDRLLMVREYDKTYGGEKKRIQKRYLPLYNKEGQLVAESIVDNKDKLMASLLYEYSVSERGNPIVEMTMYKPNNSAPQGHFYIESDQWGEVLHIESVGQDTGLHVERISMVGDSIITLRQIMASRKNRGTKDTFLTQQHLQYDRYGNPMLVETNINPTEQTELPPQEMTTHFEYYYTGDDLTSKTSENVVPDLVGKWTSNGYNIEISFGRSNLATNGIFSTSTLRDKDPEIVEEGSSWIFELRDAEIGEWYYDQKTKTITFKQRDHVITKVKANLVHYQLELQPEGEYQAGLLLRKS